MHSIKSNFGVLRWFHIGYATSIPYSAVAVVVHTHVVCTCKFNGEFILFSAN